MSKVEIFSSDIITKTVDLKTYLLLFSLDSINLLNIKS